MSLDRLIIFAAVARHRNFSRASRKLHISQPAVTKQIKLLEKEYNTTLFTRGSRGVQLTEKGKAFLKDVRRLIKRYDKLKEKFGSVSSRSSVKALSVGGSYSPSASFLPSLMARFKKNHPDVQLDLRTDNRLAVERMVLKGEVELAVINNPPLNGNLKMELYRSEPVVAFVASGHPLAKRKHVAWEDLRPVSFILRREERGSGTTVEYIKHLRMQGFSPSVRMRCDTPTEVKESVRRKIGVGVLYQDSVAESIKRREFKILKIPGEAFMGKSFIVYHKNRSLSPLAQEFLEVLRSHKIRR